ncbi:hypothetical protein AC244_30395 [Ensifer adhaerens]|uniref:Uncharacterized protein n=1 Tax=Ensifer adhaerens TaxID=106592 RepID=A0A0L8BFW2_ENSAD|nr:hypothetical protein AC244_30395 [Ensifer adhaerens]
MSPVRGAVPDGTQPLRRERRRPRLAKASGRGELGRAAAEDLRRRSFQRWPRPHLRRADGAVLSARRGLAHFRQRPTATVKTSCSGISCSAPTSIPTGRLLPISASSAKYRAALSASWCSHF